jgi:hypothetical protein
MNIQQIAGEVIKLIREGKNKQAKDTFYADDIVSVEGNGDKLQGIKAIYQKSQTRMGQDRTRLTSLWYLKLIWK